MKKFLLILFSLIFLNTPISASETLSCDNSEIVIYSNEDNTEFGLKFSNGEIITKPVYQKLIRLSEHSWIVQSRKKFGIINKDGEFLVKPKYRHAERFFGKYAKLGNSSDFGLYDADGNIIIEPKYTKIETLFGKMFLTCRNYKYGVVDMNGKQLLSNKFDDIYMPDFNTMRIKYQGEWFEIAKIDANESNIIEEDEKVTINNQTYKMSHIIVNSGIWSGYSALTFSDYVIKLISSISPAYESTIDELMLSHGTDTVSIFMGFGWLLKFPATYAQKYYTTLVAPNNGPLTEIRENVKKQLK